MAEEPLIAVEYPHQCGTLSLPDVFFMWPLSASVFAAFTLGPVFILLFIYRQALAVTCCRHLTGDISG
ncbi:hypothetical protein KCP73_14480 [Salmonella enterica subsp. enterica]|nr:hypothetical protein KCP73_14480 [Salmonella enterica subsp. enterica]